MRKLTLMLVFNPHAPSNRTTSASAIYRKHELCKKRSYEARIHEVEQSSFTPLIFSATGGMANEATMFYKRLASLLSDKWDSNYAAVMGWIRYCLSFSLLRSAIRCLRMRGSRSSKGSFGHSLGSASIDLIQVESRLPSHQLSSNSYYYYFSFFVTFNLLFLLFY